MYLLAGGMGWVGSWVARQLAMEGEEVLAVDIARRSHPHWHGLEDRIQYASASVMDFPELLNIFKMFEGRIKGIVDLAYHLPVPMWHTREEKPIWRPMDLPGGPMAHDPYKQVMTHVEGCMNLFELCRQFKVSNFVFIASGAIYGDMEGVWQEDTIDPQCFYSVSKRSVELIGGQYRRDYGLDFKSCRIMHVYGGILPLATSHPVHRVFFGPLQGLTEAHAPMGGDQLQNMTYIKDIADGICCALKTHLPKHTTFNIAGPELLTSQQIIDSVKEYLGGSLNLTLGPGCFVSRYRVGGPIDVSRAREELGYVPQYDIRKGVKDYAEWIRSIATVSPK